MLHTNSLPSNPVYAEHSCVLFSTHENNLGVPCPVLNSFCFCCIQSKHQKHQAFEAELHANADRIRGVIDMGNSLIDRGACAGSEDAVKVGAAHIG